MKLDNVLQNLGVLNATLGVIVLLALPAHGQTTKPANIVREYEQLREESCLKADEWKARYKAVSYGYYVKRNVSREDLRQAEKFLTYWAGACEIGKIDEQMVRQVNDQR